MTPAKQAEATAAAALARAERRAASQDPEALMAELADAAYGNGRWSRLDQPRRLAALVKLMEYRIGKPRQGSSTSEAAEPESDEIDTMVIR
jgi:hypothetical protein